MFEVRNYWYPKPGKSSELRQVLREMAKRRQAEGLMTSLSVQLFSPEGTIYIVSFWDHDLAAFEERRQNISMSSENQAYLTQATELSARVRMELYEILVPFPTR